MRQLLVQADLQHSPRLIALNEQDTHRLRRVLRLRAGQALTLCDGHGHTLPCTWNGDGATPVGPTSYKPAPSPQIELAVGLIKSTRWEWLIEKCVELGVGRIVPLTVRHNVVKLSPKQAATKAKRWEAIAIGAIEQCGRRWLPEITAPLSLDTWMNLNPEAPLAFGDEHPGATAATSWGRQWATADRLRVVIGPEGGLDNRERDQLRSAGATAIALSNAILRTETAAAAAVFALSGPFFDRDTPDSIP